MPITHHLPVGISFLALRSLSYVIDVYRRNIRAERNLTRFLTYTALFPLTIAGPIVRYADIVGKLTSRNVTINKFATGVRRFAIGLGKKVLIANSLAIVTDHIFGLPVNELSFCIAWLGAIAYTLQIYHDFSGYSDMAIGLGLMLGFEFPENFNYPYISKSIRDFWRMAYYSFQLVQGLSIYSAWR